VGDIAGKTSADSSSSTSVSTTNEQTGVSDQGVAIIGRGGSAVQVGGVKTGANRDFTYISQSSDPALIENVLVGGGKLIGDVVSRATAAQTRGLELTAAALNASNEREAAIEANRINPENSSQRNILIAVGIGGAVLLFSALKKH
jgi:hypothetical protein